MEENKQSNEKEIVELLNEKVEKIIKKIIDEDSVLENIALVYQLEDIHKDIKNEEYWKEKIEMMDYGYNGYGNGSYNEGSYGRRGVAGTGRGRYHAGGNYGRRGVDAKYRGNELLDEMYQTYNDYSDGKENYGADKQTMESFKYMVKSFKDYYKHLKQNASGQEEMQILDQAIDEMANM